MEGTNQVGRRRVNDPPRGTGGISSDAPGTLLVQGVAFLARPANQSFGADNDRRRATWPRRP
jgi:hypothetical protein